MSSEASRSLHPCGVCGAAVSELRRGRCWYCYTQWADLRPVGKGALCAVCGERRRGQLRLMELHNRSVSFCHSCAARAQRLAPLPHSIEEVRAALARERRQADRREDALDQRIFPRERRVDERRSAPRLPGSSSSAVLPLAAAGDDLVIEIADEDIESIEPTVVQVSPVAAEAAAEPA